MSVKYFLDTNLFIYQLEANDIEKAKIVNRLIRNGIESGNACISFQVVQECLNIITRKAEICLTTEQAELYLDKVLEPLLEIYPSIGLYKNALNIQQRYKFGFYDSLIVAAGLEANCHTLYSEDLQHKQKIAGLIIINPFL